MITNNWVGDDQGLGVYQYATGIIVEESTENARIIGNRISEVHNLGIGLGFNAGPGNVVDGNRVLLSLNTTPYAAGVSINGAACPVSITNTIASAFQPSGWNGAYYNSGSCPSPTLSGNTFDTGCSMPDCPAYTQLEPMAATNPPPLVPPQPHACVADSPYSTQTSAPPCSGVPLPPPPTAQLSASPTSLRKGASSVLTWGSSNAGSCTGNIPAIAGTQGSTTVFPQSTTTYTVSCSGPGGTASANATVKVCKYRRHC